MNSSTAVSSVALSVSFRTSCNHTGQTHHYRSLFLAHILANGSAKYDSMAEQSSAPRTFVDAIKSGQGPLLGAVLTIPNITTAQIAAQSDGDFVMVDMEHAPLPPDMVTHMIHAYTAASRPRIRFPLVRIPSHGVEYVKWAMDGGAAGVIIPMVGNADEMKAILNRALYPP